MDAQNVGRKSRLQTLDHIVFRCRKVRRVKDERGRRAWARENGMRWDSWEALASKKWVRMEDSGRVDDEGRPILERVDLMEAFFAGVQEVNSKVDKNEIIEITLFFFNCTGLTYGEAMGRALKA